MSSIKEKAQEFWLWFISKLFPRYKLIVSYNAVWGDADKTWEVFWALSMGVGRVF